MTPDEFDDLKPMQDRLVRIRFSDFQEVVAKLVTTTVDLDGSSHLIYETLEGVFHSSGEYVLRVALSDDPNA